MTDILVAGGRQRGVRPTSAGLDWYEYEAGIVVRVRDDDVEAIHEYVSPPDVVPDEEPVIIFKSGSIDGDRLYLSTQNEVIVYRAPTMERVAYISIPQFNDVHHVAPLPNGNVVVAITGLDMVVEVTLDGEVVRAWDVTGSGLWHRFSPDVDYRKVKSTKPHVAHPNYVFRLGDEIWATRFEHRDAISLDDPSRRIDIGIERIHDGVVHGSSIYFTSVDGHLAIADAESLTVSHVVDLAQMHPPATRLGWARGVHVVDDRFVWVGFSRIRPTKFRENVAWVARGFRRDLGTHVALYDLRRRVLVADVNLEAAGVGAVFGIYPTPIG